MLVRTDCATKEMGPAACNPELGVVGWSKGRPCMPCPKECSSCEDIRKKSAKPVFKCILRPTIGFPTPSIKSLTEEASEYNANDFYELPPNLECQKAEPRSCKSIKSGWCKSW